MSSLMKLAYISKKNLRPFQLVVQRFISTSKKNQEVCVTNAEITEQEPVIFLINNIEYWKLSVLKN